MIMTLPSFLAAAETRARWVGRNGRAGASQAIYFVTTLLCSHLGRESSTIAGALAVREAGGKFQVERHFASL